MRIRALVFDDDESIRSALWHLLDSRGYEVFTFPDARHCPLHLSKNCPCSEDYACSDIIISDLNMPVTSGLEFIEGQKRKGCKVKNVALMSGSWTDSDLQTAGKLGCQPFRKPFSIHEINEWLDQCEKEIDPKRVLSNWFREPPYQST